MPSNHYPLIAKEGWLGLFVLACLLTASYFFAGNLELILLGVLFLFFLYLIRDPSRTIPSLPLAIVSPVQGKVIGIDEADDRWLSRNGIHRRAHRIRIKMSAFDVYSLRSPIEGKVMEQWAEKCKLENGLRKFAFWIRTDEGDDIVTIFRLGSLNARLFKIYIQSGGRLGQGQRCGFLYFGGVVDVLIPQNAKVEVETGNTITSGQDILAQLVHSERASFVNDDNPHGKYLVSGDAG